MKTFEDKFAFVVDIVNRFEYNGATNNFSFDIEHEGMFYQLSYQVRISHPITVREQDDLVKKGYKPIASNTPRRPGFAKWELLWAYYVSHDPTKLVYFSTVPIGGLIAMTTKREKTQLFRSNRQQFVNEPFETRFHNDIVYYERAPALPGPANRPLVYPSSASGARTSTNPLWVLGPMTLVYPIIPILNPGQQTTKS